MADRGIHWVLGALLAPCAIPLVAYSQVYLTVDEATKALFPGESFRPRKLDLTALEIQRIERLSGEKVRHPSVDLRVGQRRDLVFIDQVLGKHEFITYAVGIGANGKVAGIEILEYRESYGSQIQGKGWRKQFTGKDASSPLRLGTEIVNISGATLSSAHVTAGVKRLLQTYDTIHGRI